MNNYFKDILVNKIKATIYEANMVKEVQHHGLEGRFREILVQNLLEPLLPKSFAIGTGKITDLSNHISRQLDLLIYTPFLLPSLLYSESEGVFPVESCFYSIEIKTKLDSTELKKAIDNAKSLQQLEYSAGIYDNNDQPIDHKIIKVLPTFFAFNSDLKSSPDKELERYKKRDNEWDSNPAVRAFCIIGKGYWYFEEKTRSWEYFPHDDDFREIRGFLSGIINTLEKSKELRRSPRFGRYLLG